MKKTLVIIVSIVIVAAALWILQQNKAQAPTGSNQITEKSMNENTNSQALEREAKYAIAEEEVTYFQNVKGFYARPDADGTFSGVVMIHEWWGLNDNVRDMARQLAGQGYQVLAVDLYNGEYATTADKARELVTSIKQETATNNMRAAANYLRERGATRLASLGWCFGGGQSLQLALSGEQLDATILYYGTPLVTDPQKLAAIGWPVLGVFGDKDQSIPVSSVQEFQSSLSANKIQNEVYVYPGVGHAFANPSGANYAPSETRDAWEKTLTFLTQALK